MNIENLTIIYFSPTSTTRTTLENIAKGMGIPVAQTIDITRPDTRSQKPDELKGQVLLIGAPVYGGRLPRIAEDFFRTLNASKTPAIPVVVYGNREFEDALLELKDILDQAGFVTVAAGAFLGEHSFSSQTHEIAPGRPDREDLSQARQFGTKVADLLATTRELSDLAKLEVSGNFPYKERKPPRPVEFMGITDDCDECSTCVAICPVQAIDSSNGYAVKDEVCIHCCACIKACPRGARIMKEGPFKDITKWLAENFTKRKDPQTFFPR